uniref:auxin-responsive protein SAUR76 n=1 Tax=Erigeron canadensis TaxID=72917 RepID=UPI001CB9C1A3|nr:auxin-responsive protein SAUR76 [Erigeron canadensis]
MKTINVMLRKCKTLSKQLTRTSSSNNVRSKSSRHFQSVGGIIWNTNAISAVYDDHSLSDSEQDPKEPVYVGSTRKRYVISSKYLCHPLVNALIEKVKTNGDVHDNDNDNDNNVVSVINCEVVLFDHLLWMLDNNADLNASTTDSLDELAELYSS